MWYCFFFQAEDGIRDADVTGVQTCALPIYHEPGVEPAKPADELVEGNVAPDREVVDEREAEDEVGPAALLEPPALEPAPAETGRGVGDVHDEWQDRARALAPKPRVELPGHALVTVDRDDRVRFQRAGEAGVVAAEIPGELRGARLADEALLPL